VTGIDAAREAIRARRRAVAAAVELLDSQVGRAATKRVVVRCDQPHKGSRPKLAEAVVVQHQLLFVSRINWMPSDQLTLRPWARDHLEGAGMSDGAFELAMTDDRFLRRLLADNDAWQAGVKPSGERWLVKADPHWIQAAVPLDPGAGTSLGLWTRCSRHPDAVAELTCEALVGALR
jgi:hypothetical protein